MAGWDIIKDDDLSRVSVMDTPEGYLIKTEHYVQPVLDRNAELRAQNSGKRWGGGQIAASIPNSLFFAELAEAKRNRDTKYVKRWLNDPDHRKFRTFEGTI